jgi:PiT family inorganic phosphate transporter
MTTVTLIVLIVGLTAGLYMAWNIGANDVANAMGTSVGSGALTLAGAVIIAAIFEFGGAVLVGSRVTRTIRSGILDTAVFAPDVGMFGADGPLLLMLGMVAALLAAGIWLQLATTYGLPVSTTHSIVGAVVGFGVLTAGISSVEWLTVLRIAASWVISPAAGGLLGFAMFVYLRRTILRHSDPAQRVRRQAPLLVGLVVLILFLSFVYKGLKNVLHDPAWWMVLAGSALVAIAAAAGARVAVERTSRIAPDPYQYVERIFGWLQILTASFVAFAHGANDVANAIGPLAAIVHIAQSGEISGAVPVPFWVLMLGGFGIVVGLATWGYKVIRTIGREITEMLPSRGFSAEFGAASVVLVFSLLGLPISTTHTLVGAVIGVGLAHGISALNLKVVRNIVNSWIITLPASAVLAAVIFAILRWIFV